MENNANSKGVAMTDNEIIKLAREAGFKYADVEGIWITAGFWDKELAAFAKLVAEKEDKHEHCQRNP
jgi:hypothetical protein